MEVDDVGPLPNLPPPNAGEHLSLKLQGRPPAKTISRSLRNPSSSQVHQFMALRHAAIDAMGGRKWHEGGIGIFFRYLCPEDGGIFDDVFPYLSGVVDTIGGSNGPSFIYLPIVYLDDGQVAKVTFSRDISPVEGYEIGIDFLG